MLEQELDLARTGRQPEKISKNDGVYKMEYIIVKVEWPESVSTLTKKVQAKIEEGFEPLGGMSTWNDKLEGRCFTQTMVKLYEPPIVQIDSPLPIDPHTGKPYEGGVGW